MKLYLKIGWFLLVFLFININSVFSQNIDSLKSIQNSSQRRITGGIDTTGIDSLNRAHRQNSEEKNNKDKSDSTKITDEFLDSVLGDSTANTVASDSLKKTSDSSAYIEDIPLEELFGIDVTSVSSKKEETTVNAPGNVTVYTSKDMEVYGLYTLRDLANITFGYSGFNSIGETVFETRGIMQTGFDNNRHLVFVDGIPFNHTRANMAPAQENLPLYFSESVEFLKGPGSALYGTSAFTGVMSITPKELKENGSQIEAKFSGGNVDFKKRAMVNFLSKTDEGVSRLTANYFAKDATRDLLGNGQFPNVNSKNYDNTSAIFINAYHKLTDGKLKGLGGGFIYSRESGGMGEFWMFQQNQNYEFNEITWEIFVPYLKFERELNKKLTFNSYLKGNISNEKAYTGGFQQIVNPSTSSLIATKYNIRVFDRELLGELKYKLHEKATLIGGINVISRFSAGAPENYAYYLYAQPGLTFQPDTTYYQRSGWFNIYSCYAQYQQDFPVLAGMHVTAGARLDIGRFNYSSDNSSNVKFNPISPRISIVQDLTDKMNLKLMIGRALRAPMLKEIGLNNEVLSQSLGSPVAAPFVNLIPTLKPETFLSYELAYNYYVKKIQFVVTCFFSKLKDQLSARLIPELENRRVFVNQAGIIKTLGYEAEVQYKPTKNFTIVSNYSYAFSKLPDGNQMANVPVSKLNGIVTYFLKKPNVSFALISHWITNYRSGQVNEFIKSQGFATDNSLMKGFCWVDFNTVGRINKNIALELRIANLLNTEIRTPSGILNSGMLNIPYPKRYYLASIDFKF